MITIKLLDRPPFFYHQYEKLLKYKKDEFGEWHREQPDKSWLLPYQPAYVSTDEIWLIKKLREYAASAFEKVDIITDTDLFFYCSIPQEMLNICIPSDNRYIKNEIPDMPDDEHPYTSDGYKIKLHDLDYDDLVKWNENIGKISKQNNMH